MAHNFWVGFGSYVVRADSPGCLEQPAAEGSWHPLAVRFNRKQLLEILDKTIPTDAE